MIAYAIIILAISFALCAAAYSVGRRSKAYIETQYVDLSGIGNSLPTFTDVLAGKTMAIDLGDGLYVEFALHRAEIVHRHLPVIKGIVSTLADACEVGLSSKAIIQIYKLLAKEVLAMAIPCSRKAKKRLEQKMLDVEFADGIIERLLDYHTAVKGKKKLLAQGKTPRNHNLPTVGEHCTWNSLIAASGSAS